MSKYSEQLRYRGTGHHYFILAPDGNDFAKWLKLSTDHSSHQPPALRPRTMKYRTLVRVNSTGVLMETPHSDFEAKFLGEAAHQRFD